MDQSNRNKKEIIRAENLSIGYKKSGKISKNILSDINLSIYEGQIVCLLGPNGCGKSTLLRTFAGIQPPLLGRCLVGGQAVHRKEAKEIAKLLSIVLTEKVDGRGLTVYDVVSIGRHPHTNWLGKLGDSDGYIIERSLEQVGLLHYSSNYLYELSDGEKQRVMIAKTLAQDTPFIMLDEPTAHLDLPNRVEIMKLLRSLAKSMKKAILLSTHELDLALQAADYIWLMGKDRPIQVDVPEDLVLNGSLQATFASNSFEFDETSGAFRMHHTYCGKVHLEGSTHIGYWTQRALEREGFEVCDNTGLSIHVSTDKSPGKWYLSLSGVETTLSSVGELLDAIKDKACLPD